MSIQHRLATPVIQPRMRFFDTDGKPLVGGKVYAFKVGTEEFKPTYRNSELTALNTNPVILDGAGSALIYLRGANLLKIYDRHGNFIEERIEYQQRERAQFYDDYGRPLKNGYVYTYDYQSTIRKTSYSIDNVINPNPIALDENGTALVNIVGAYRLRQYDKKGVFVGDQDFKRPPIKALTSKPYPAYFVEGIATNPALNNRPVLFDVPAIDERISANVSLLFASTREVMNSYTAQPELVYTSLALVGVSREDTRDTYQKTAMQPESVLTAISLTDAARKDVLIKHEMQSEDISTSLSLIGVQITN